LTQLLSIKVLNYHFKMKTTIRILLFLFIFNHLTVCYASYKPNNFQSFKKTEKSFNLLSYTSNTQRTLKLKLQDDSDDILSLLEGTLFVTGVVLFFTNNSNDSHSLYNYSSRNTGIILMGISAGGGIIHLLSSSGYSGSNHYGPRSSLNNYKNMQLSISGGGLGLRMNF
jgi:hypothetical protein